MYASFDDVFAAWSASKVDVSDSAIPSRALSRTLWSSRKTRISPQLSLVISRCQYRPTKRLDSLQLPSKSSKPPSRTARIPKNFTSTLPTRFPCSSIWTTSDYQLRSLHWSVSFVRIPNSPVTTPNIRASGADYFSTNLHSKSPHNLHNPVNDSEARYINDKVKKS